MSPVEIARLFLHVREAGQNQGLRVEAIQKWSGGKKGDSWCAQFATMVLDLAFKGEAPIPRNGSCDVILKLAQQKGWDSEKPDVNDLYLVLRSATDACHVGFVTSTEKWSERILGTISGNTSADGLSDNGDRVAERDVKYAPGRVVFIKYPR